VRFLRFRSVALCIGLLPASTLFAQQMPRDYRGVQVMIPGIYVTPVPNAPFSATVDITSQEFLPDGSINVLTSIAHVARANTGQIYNESRRLVPPSFQGEPALVSAHIYDPNTHLNIFYNPFQHIARESLFHGPPAAPANTVPTRIPANNPYFRQEDLGSQVMNGLTLNGIRKTHIIPAAQSSTAKDVVITDEYWYSPDLSIYVVIKHDDPRTGEQLVAVTNVNRSEPAASVFAVPAHYKIIDENPPAQPVP
jgi:hypothetical protein